MQHFDIVVPFTNLERPIGDFSRWHGDVDVVITVRAIGFDKERLLMQAADTNPILAVGQHKSSVDVKVIEILGLGGTTETELKAIAKAAKAGLNAIPNKRYNAPAAEGSIRRL